MSHTRHLINQLSIPFVGFRGIATLEGVSNPLLSIPFVGFVVYSIWCPATGYSSFNSLCWVHTTPLADKTITFYYLSIPFVGFSVMKMPTTATFTLKFLSIPFVGFAQARDEVGGMKMGTFNSLCWVQETYKLQ